MMSHGNDRPQIR